MARCVYIYIHTNVCVCVYIYIYIYILYICMYIQVYTRDSLSSPCTLCTDGGMFLSASASAPASAC